MRLSKMGLLWAVFALIAMLCPSTAKAAIYEYRPLQKGFVTGMPTNGRIPGRWRDSFGLLSTVAGYYAQNGAPVSPPPVNTNEVFWAPGLMNQGQNDFGKLSAYRFDVLPINRPPLYEGTTTARYLPEGTVTSVSDDGRRLVGNYTYVLLDWSVYNAYLANPSSAPQDYTSWQYGFVRHTVPALWQDGVPVPIPGLPSDATVQHISHDGNWLCGTGTKNGYHAFWRGTWNGSGLQNLIWAKSLKGQARLVGMLEDADRNVVIQRYDAPFSSVFVWSKSDTFVSIVGADVYCLNPTNRELGGVNAAGDATTWTFPSLVPTSLPVKGKVLAISDAGKLAGVVSTQADTGFVWSGGTLYTVGRYDFHYSGFGTQGVYQPDVTKPMYFFGDDILYPLDLDAATSITSPGFYPRFFDAVATIP